MLTEDIQYKLLYRCLSEKKWKSLKASTFAQKYEDEVGDMAAAVLAVHVSDLGTVYELVDGLTAVEEPTGKWTLYETEKRAKERDHFRAWAEFARGYWSAKTPTEPGLYFVRDADLGKRSVRELKIVNARLKDVSGGMVRAGLVSEWVGDWYLPKIPLLPGSF